MMNRRDWMKRLGSLAGAALILPAATGAAQETCRGWHLRWSGWKEPVNQTVRVGYWYAWRESTTRPCAIWYATTLGVVATALECEVLDLTWADRSTPIYPWQDDKEFNAAQESARRRLISALERP